MTKLEQTRLDYEKAAVDAHVAEQALMQARIAYYEAREAHFMMLEAEAGVRPPRMPVFDRVEGSRPAIDFGIKRA